MKPSTATVLGMFLVIALAVGVSMLLPWDAGERSGAATAPLADYHPSDPSMIASTARPQLLEFFHPQ